VIQYLKELGVTSVELLPVHLFVSDRHLVARGLSNYWGYNTLGFFAPHAPYMADPANGLREFREMVARFHEAGLEVLLDVVYNHTGEGNELGPTLSFRGIDNASYYRLAADSPRYYSNETGTGNTLNTRHPRVTQMITDSLRYWVTDMQVDGFRFDLGTTLGRPDACFDEHSGFLTACIQDPVLSTVKLIAEPWDCGPGGYQVGRFPPGWAEWNDQFRDGTRDFWRGQASAGDLSRLLCASADVFDRRGRKPWSSINFVTSHDGFTLRDLVSYKDRHNDANGEQNTDGNPDNRSENYGVEGPTDDPSIVAMRDRQVRNMLGTLLTAQGTPMLAAGDEFGRTQRGNNNAYCQDNETSWIDWDLAERYGDLTQFVRALTRLRHGCKLVRQTHFLTGTAPDESSPRDVVWIDVDGREMTNDAWSDPSSRAFGMYLSDQSAEPAGATALLLLFDPQPGSRTWTLPVPGENGRWLVRIDATHPENEGGFVHGAAYTSSGPSFAALELVRSARA
jgi:glycogen operon protein